MIFSLEERRKRFGKRWRRKNLVRKLLKRTQVMLLVIINEDVEEQLCEKDVDVAGWLKV